MIVSRPPDTPPADPVGNDPSGLFSTAHFPVTGMGSPSLTAAEKGLNWRPNSNYNSCPNSIRARVLAKLVLCHFAPIAKPPSVQHPVLRGAYYDPNQTRRRKTSPATLGRQVPRQSLPPAH